jgi:hypothetical protein
MFSAERPGPVPQLVFKTSTASQPDARQVRLLCRSVKAKISEVQAKDISVAPSSIPWLIPWKPLRIVQRRCLPLQHRRAFSRPIASPFFR